MTRLIREFDDLVLDRRAVSRPYAFDLPAIQRRAWNRLPQNAPCLLGGITDVARNLRPRDLPGQERKRRRIGVTRLRFEPLPVDAATVEPRRRTGLQPHPRKTEGPQLIAQQFRRRLAIPPATVLHLADVGQAIQEGPRSDDHRARIDPPAVAQMHAGHAPSVQGQRRHFRLLDPQVRLFLQYLAHVHAVHPLVHLRARRPHCRTAAGIEQPELNPHRIRHLAHQPA